MSDAQGSPDEAAPRPAVSEAAGRIPVVEDRLLDGRLRLRQPARGHKAGTDAVLLAVFAAPSAAGARVVDLGAGVGTVGLVLAALDPAARITLVEREPALAALARENAELNGWPERVEVVETDALAPGAAREAAGLGPGCADLVVTNPPWFAPGEVRPSPQRQRRRSHVFEAGTLDAWLRVAASLLRPRGELWLVHRADALPELLAGLSGRFGAVAIRPLHPQAAAPATRLVVRAVKGSRARPSIEPGLVLHAANGRFTPEAEALHRGRLLQPDGRPESR